LKNIKTVNHSPESFRGWFEPIPIIIGSNFLKRPYSNVRSFLFLLLSYLMKARVLEKILFCMLHLDTLKQEMSYNSHIVREPIYKRLKQPKKQFTPIILFTSAFFK
jgi:hypothetical protein